MLLKNTITLLCCRSIMRINLNFRDFSWSKTKFMLTDIIFIRYLMLKVINNKIDGCFILFFCSFLEWYLVRSTTFFFSLSLNRELPHLHFLALVKSKVMAVSSDICIVSSTLTLLLLRPLVLVLIIFVECFFLHRFYPH